MARPSLKVMCVYLLPSCPPTVHSVVACQHPALLGARASRAICLVSRLPCLAAMEVALKKLYTTVSLGGWRVDAYWGMGVATSFFFVLGGDPVSLKTLFKVKPTDCACFNTHKIRF